MLPPSVIVPQSSAGATDPAAVPPVIAIGAVAIVASGTTSSTSTTTFVIVYIYAPSLRTDCHRKALDYRPSGVSGRVHAIIDRKVAANEVSAHRSVLAG